MSRNVAGKLDLANCVGFDASYSCQWEARLELYFFNLNQTTSLQSLSFWQACQPPYSQPSTARRTLTTAAAPPEGLVFFSYCSILSNALGFLRMC